MRKLQLAVALKRKAWLLKFRLWRHRLEYHIHQNTEDWLFGALMFGCFVMQLVLYLVREHGIQP